MSKCEYILREFRDGHISDTPVAPVFDGEYDVIVAGLGTAGTAAAMRLGGFGLRVLGVESLASPGGTVTNTGIWKYYYGAQGGVYRKIDERFGEYSADGMLPDAHNLIGMLSDDDLITASGADVLYGSLVCGVYMTGNRVRGVRLLTPDGERSYSAEYVIDCTGDGSVAMSAGCEMRCGREEGKPFMPYCNVRLYVKKTDAGDRLAYKNYDSGFVDQYDPFEYGRCAVSSCTSPAYLRENYAEGERILSVQPHLGIREGRSVVGRETLRLGDIAAGRITDKPLFWSYTHLDDHAVESAFYDDDYVRWIAVCNLWRTAIEFPVPAGTMLPRGVDGLITAGRMISADMSISKGFRMIRDVYRSGEAAGLLAALAVKEGVSPEELPYEKLRDELCATGCLGDGDCFRFADRKGHRLGRYESVEALLEDFASPFAGWAVFCASRLEELSPIRAALGSPDKRIRFNAARALGAAGDRSDALNAVLLEMLTDRDGLNDDCLHAHPYSVCAAAICGLCEVREAIPVLLDIIASDECARACVFTPDEFCHDRGELYVQYYTHARRALRRIAAKYPETADEIQSAISRREAQPDFSLRVKLWASPQYFDIVSRSVI